jgi:hypothetical protein
VFWRGYFFIYALLWLAGNVLLLSGVIDAPRVPWVAHNLLDVLALLALWDYAFPRRLLSVPLFWKVWLHLDVALTVVTMALGYQAVSERPMPAAIRVGVLIGMVIGAIVQVLPPLIATYRLGYGVTLEEAKATRFPSQSVLIAG